MRLVLLLINIEPRKCEKTFTGIAIAKIFPAINSSGVSLFAFTIVKTHTNDAAGKPNPIIGSGVYFSFSFIKSFSSFILYNRGAQWRRAFWPSTAAPRLEFLIFWFLFIKNNSFFLFQSKNCPPSPKCKG